MPDTNPVGTKENRQQFRKMTIQIAESALTGNETLLALDGLDIAEKMVDNLKKTGHEGNTINCLRCRFVAEWDKWQGER